MKNIFRVFLCIAALVSVQSPVTGQMAYSITDNNRDVLQLDQQYYQFDLATGAGTLIGTLTLNGQQIRREYEGLASIGSELYGVAEFDTELCNTGSDPITGLASDVRTFRTAAFARDRYVFNLPLNLKEKMITGNMYADFSFIKPEAANKKTPVPTSLVLHDRYD